MHRRLEQLFQCVSLERFDHETRQDGMCAMEFVAYLAGEPHGDQPACVGPALTAYVIALNDAMAEDWRQRLKPFLPRLIDTNDGWTERRAARLIARAKSTFVPMAAHAGFGGEQAVARATEGLRTADYFTVGAHVAYLVRLAKCWPEALATLDELLMIGKTQRPAHIGDERTLAPLSRPSAPNLARTPFVLPSLATAGSHLEKELVGGAAGVPRGPEAVG